MSAVPEPPKINTTRMLQESLTAYQRSGLDLAQILDASVSGWKVTTWEIQLINDVTPFQGLYRWIGDIRSAPQRYDKELSQMTQADRLATIRSDSMREAFGYSKRIKKGDWREALQWLRQVRSVVADFGNNFRQALCHLDLLPLESVGDDQCNPFDRWTTRLRRTLISLPSDVDFIKTSERGKWTCLAYTSVRGAKSELVRTLKYYSFSFESYINELSGLSSLNLDANDFYPASHYKDLYGISDSRLRKARETGRLSAKRCGRLWHYSESSAAFLWPHEVTSGKNGKQQ